jgi:hypothetical protein
MDLQYLLTPQHVYEYADRKYLTWVTNGYENADEEILPLIKMLNTIPGVSTTSSCASKLDDAKDMFYVTMACVSMSALADVSKFFNALRNEVHSTGMIGGHRVGLHFNYLPWKHPDASVKTKHVPFVSINMRLRNETERQLFFNALQAAVTKISLEQIYWG